jgi:hypothetical protein
VQALATQAIPAACTTAVLQLFVQLPHFVTSAVVFDSQPVLPVAQWLKPALHAHLHEPARQEADPFVVLQTVPH